MNAKLLALVTALALVSAENTTNEIPKDITDNISFIYYYGNTFNENITYSYDNASEVVFAETFNKSATTVIFMHGYSEKPTVHDGTYSSDIIPQGFFKADFPRNLIVVDYQNLVPHYYNVTPWTAALNMLTGYVIAASNTVPIGKAVGNFLRRLEAECNCAENFHLIGFSLGAHIASNAAKQFGLFLLRIITGLDPAGPMFQPPMLPYLQKTDAKSVVVIHTDGGRLGMSQDCGTIDFRPNRGTHVQPACSVSDPVKCDHYMSTLYFSISITDPGIFVATQCDTYASWVLHFCDKNPKILMGYYTPENETGQFYLRTGATIPYGQGRSGSLP